MLHSYCFATSHKLIRYTKVKRKENGYIMRSNNINDYLECTEIINFDDTNIQIIANKLIKTESNNTNIIKIIYEFVRDKIDHTFDINGKIITCIASDVLLNKQGICYAKSHLLAALLRYSKIPCGFGYQKLILDDNDKNWIVLHGYNYVFLKDFNKWIKLDARGNKKGVNAIFSIDKESLAFPIRIKKGESDENINHFQPKENVINSLNISRNLEELIMNLPKDY